MWSLSLHSRDGLLPRIESGETEFVIESEGDLVRMEGERVADSHARIRITSNRLEIEDLAGGTCVNGRVISGQTSTGYPATIPVGEFSLAIESVSNEAIR